jgi:hypothetical protein
MNLGGGLAKYTTLIFLMAERTKATHIRMIPTTTEAPTSTTIEMWHDGAWHLSDLTTHELKGHLQLMGHLAGMMQGKLPPQGSIMTGNFALTRSDVPDLCILGALVHDVDVAAYFELVDEVTYASGRAPQPPPGRPKFRDA